MVEHTRYAHPTSKIPANPGDSRAIPDFQLLNPGIGSDLASYLPLRPPPHTVYSCLRAIFSPQHPVFSRETAGDSSETRDSSESRDWKGRNRGRVSGKATELWRLWEDVNGGGARVLCRSWSTVADVCPADCATCGMCSYDFISPKNKNKFSLVVTQEGRGTQFVRSLARKRVFAFSVEFLELIFRRIILRVNFSANNSPCFQRV
jgi:hypothetical protein